MEDTNDLLAPITVKQVISALAAGVPQEELLPDYPELEADDIRAALLYARELVAGNRSLAPRPSF